MGLGRWRLLLLHHHVCCRGHVPPQWFCMQSLAQSQVWLAEGSWGSAARGWKWHLLPSLCCCPGGLGHFFLTRASRPGIAALTVLNRAAGCGDGWRGGKLPVLPLGSGGALRCQLCLALAACGGRGVGFCPGHCSSAWEWPLSSAQQSEQSGQPPPSPGHCWDWHLQAVFRQVPGAAASGCTAARLFGHEVAVPLGVAALSPPGAVSVPGELHRPRMISGVGISEGVCLPGGGVGPPGDRASPVGLLPGERCLRGRASLWAHGEEGPLPPLPFPFPNSLRGRAGSQAVFTPQRRPI